MSDSGSPTDQVSTIMSTKIVTTKTSETLRNALRKMVKQKIGSIVAVEDGKPVGILTERDISIQVAKSQSLQGLTVKRIMSKPLITINPSTDISDAVEQMIRKDIRRLPVIEEGKLIGMVTERDILRWLLITAYEPNLPEDLKKLITIRAQAHSIVG